MLKARVYGLGVSELRGYSWNYWGVLNFFGILLFGTISVGVPYFRKSGLRLRVEGLRVEGLRLRVEG